VLADYAMRDELEATRSAVEARLMDVETKEQLLLPRADFEAFRTQEFTGVLADYAMRDELEATRSAVEERITEIGSELENGSVALSGLMNEFEVAQDLLSSEYEYNAVARVKLNEVAAELHELQQEALTWSNYVADLAATKQEIKDLPDIRQVSKIIKTEQAGVQEVIGQIQERFAAVDTLLSSETQRVTANIQTTLELEARIASLLEEASIVPLVVEEVAELRTQQEHSEEHQSGIERQVSSLSSLLEVQRDEMRPILARFKGLSEQMREMHERARELANGLKEVSGPQSSIDLDKRAKDLARDSGLLMGSIADEFESLSGSSPSMEQRVALLNDVLYAVSLNISKLIGAAPEIVTSQTVASRKNSPELRKRNAK